MKRIFVVLSCFVLIAIFNFLFVNIVDIYNYECPFKKVFHIYCAGCGMTRMFKSIFSLEICQAFRYNPLMFIYFIVFIIYAIMNSVRYILGKEFKRISFKVVMIFVIVAFIFMVMRNIPLFSYLKPIKVK